MSLTRARDLLSVAQITLAVLTVALGGGASLVALALALLLSVLAFVRKLPPEPSKLAKRAWTAIVLVALVASIARAFLRAEFLDAGVDFLLLLVVQRLFNRQQTREHLQLLLLGAVLVVIGAVVNADLNFPILLALFLPISTMALIVNQLVAESERLGDRVRYDLRRQAPRHLRLMWRWAIQVAGFAAVGGLFVFLVFPRFGAGVFLRGNFATQTSSGFSDEVRLGGFGNIKDDATVVMHMVPITDVPRQNRLTWHLRGSAFDRYEDGHWRHSKLADRAELLRDRRYWFFRNRHGRVGQYRRTSGLGRSGTWGVTAKPVPGIAASEDVVRAVVTLDDIGTELLFAASEPLGVALTPRGAIERRNIVAADVDHQIRVLNKQPGPIQYEFASRIGKPTREELDVVGNPIVPAELAEPYLQRAESLSPEFTKYATSVVGDAESRIDKVDAVMKHLASFEYTTEQSISPRVAAGGDPVEGFVLDTKRGHCEYFATAMALMLREVGVPTRNVNGYYGAHYNEMGDFYAVRQADAHSWVEVHFGELGWVTFDPTPPSGRTAGDDASLFPAGAKAIDALRNAYLNYVIDYDLGKQLQVLEQMGVNADRNELRVEVDWWRLAAWIGTPIVVIAAAVAILRRRRKRHLSHEARVYLSLLADLERRGHVREASESPRRFAARVAERHPALGAALARFSEVYEALRFGPTPADRPDSELDRLAREVKARAKEAESTGAEP